MSLALAACAATSQPSFAPSPTGTTETFSATATPTPTPEPTVLEFPGVSEVELVPGRYDSSPPFDIEFTFVVPDAGWKSAHIHREFFDVMRFDGPDPRIPTRWIAWAHPQTLFGSSEAVAADLAPQAAAELMAGNPDVEAGPIRPFEFASLRGVQLDLHADVENTHVFGGPDGNFGMEPGFDLRLGIVQHDAGLLLVLCLAAAPEALDAVCEEVQPILDSAHL